MAPTLKESDPELDCEDDEERESETERSNISSILSDESSYPLYEPEPCSVEAAAELTFYQCCVKNDAKLLQEKLETGLTQEEVRELDINGRVIEHCYSPPPSPLGHKTRRDVQVGNVLNSALSPYHSTPPPKKKVIEN